MINFFKKGNSVSSLLKRKRETILIILSNEPESFSSSRIDFRFLKAGVLSSLRYGIYIPIFVKTKMY